MEAKNITPELRKKAEGKTAQELVELAEAEGIELTDEQLDAVSGGDIWTDGVIYDTECTSCGKTVTWYNEADQPSHCPYCGHYFLFD